MSTEIQLSQWLIKSWVICLFSVSALSFASLFTFLKYIISNYIYIYSTLEEGIRSNGATLTDVCKSLCRCW